MKHNEIYSLLNKAAIDTAETLMYLDMRFTYALLLYFLLLHVSIYFIIYKLVHYP